MIKLQRYTNREEWLENRRTGIGGSDIADILGISRYGSPFSVWVAKVYGASDLRDTGAMRFGRDTEPMLAKWFEEDTGLKTRRNNYILAHDDYPFLIANIDREIVGGGILEIKTTNAYNKDSWDDKVPDEYMCQLQWYLGITGNSFGYFCCLMGSRDFVIYKVDFDKELFDVMVNKAVYFWNKFVIPKVAPIAGGRDIDALKRLYPEGIPETSIELSEAAEIAACQRKEALEIITRQTKIKDEAEAILRQEMGDNEQGATDNIIVTLKKPKNLSFDVDKLKAEYPEIYNECCAKEQKRRLNVRESIKN